MINKQEVYDYINTVEHVSMAELEREFQTDKPLIGKHKILEIVENTYIWSSANEELIDVINELVFVDRKAMVTSLSFMCYMFDGGVLDLPLAKRNMIYKKPHWVPCIINTVDHVQRNKDDYIKADKFEFLKGQGYDLK